MTTPPIDLVACRARQERLLEQLHHHDLDRVFLTRMESVQWLTGARVGPLFQTCATLDATGLVTLVLPSRKRDTPAAVDEVVTYQEKWLSTMRDASEQRTASVAALLAALPAESSRPACEFSAASTQLLNSCGGDWFDIDATMFRLRRKKDADEILLLKRANDANRVMYERARELIKPGINELDLYSELQTVAVRELGEPLTYFGQDFRCAARGGAPRDRLAQAGELFILDLGVGLRGYHSDNARTIAVDRSPTEAQQQAWEQIAAVFPMVEATIKPGTSCSELYERAKEMLAEAPLGVFNHHLGHGVGLAPHEGPHLNPNWDDTFEVGDFIAVEPGLYDEDLNHGIRLEQNYVVTETGVDLVTDWPLELC